MSPRLTQNDYAEASERFREQISSAERSRIDELIDMTLPKGKG